MRFSNLYIKKKLKSNLLLWLNLKKNYCNSIFLNYFFKYFLIFNFNSFNSFNLNFFKNFLNFSDLGLFKLNNFSKFFFLKLLKNLNCATSTFSGNFFCIIFLNLYAKFDFYNFLNDVDGNTLSRFNILCIALGKNFVKNKFLFKKNFIWLNRISAKLYKNLVMPIFKFIIKYYLNFIYLLLFNYLNFFSKLIFITIKKLFFFNVNNTPVR